VLLSFGSGIPSIMQVGVVSFVVMILFPRIVWCFGICKVGNYSPDPLLATISLGMKRNSIKRTGSFVYLPNDENWSAWGTKDSYV